MHQLAEPRFLMLGTTNYCVSYSSAITTATRYIYKTYYAPLFPELRVNDWRDTKLELNYLFYSVTVKVYCQLENEYKLINSIFVWHAAERGVMEGGLFHSGAVQMFNFQLIHGQHERCEHGAARPPRNK